MDGLKVVCVMVVAGTCPTITVIRFVCVIVAAACLQIVEPVFAKGRSDAPALSTGPRVVVVAVLECKILVKSLRCSRSCVTWPCIYC